MCAWSRDTTNVLPPGKSSLLNIFNHIDFLRSIIRIALADKGGKSFIVFFGGNQRKSSVLSYKRVQKLKTKHFAEQKCITDL